MQALMTCAKKNIPLRVKTFRKLCVFLFMDSDIQPDRTKCSQHKDHIVTVKCRNTHTSGKIEHKRLHFHKITNAVFSLKLLKGLFL